MIGERSGDPRGRGGLAAALRLRPGPGTMDDAPDRTVLHRAFGQAIHHIQSRTSAVPA